MMKGLIIILIVFLSSCLNLQESEAKRLRQLNQVVEPIQRKASDCRLQTEVPSHRTRLAYPWEETYMGAHPRITREYFRCSGSILNPAYYRQEKDEKVRYADCGGKEQHSLPLKEGKEFIYPILIDLLNFLQWETGKRVVITSGHRCPQHNSYVDSGLFNRSSKHLLGAEVDFYIQGMEWKPREVIDLIHHYYNQNESYSGAKEYLEFKPVEKNEQGLVFTPLYNKEILIKIFSHDEGRNFDNRHPYPYISIQVRYDRAGRQRVLYSWDLAVRNYLRW